MMTSSSLTKTGPIGWLPILLLAGCGAREVTGTPTSGVGIDEAPSECIVTGVSGEVCADTKTARSVRFLCASQAECACCDTAVCERQSDGECGWTNTPELSECLALARNEVQQPEAQVQPEARALDSQIDPETQLEPEAQLEIETQVDSEAQLELETQVVPEAQFEAETLVAPEDQVEVETLVDSEAQPEVEGSPSDLEIQPAPCANAQCGDLCVTCTSESCGASLGYCNFLHECTTSTPTCPAEN